MQRLTRRTLLKRIAAGGIAATATISGTKSSGQVLGANERIRVAVAGINGRGQIHAQIFGEMKDVEVAYLVDPDSRLFAPRSAAVEQLTGKKPKCVQDIREVLDDPAVDAVTIAAPNHWHALMTIWACEAGKDVYVEKPCSQNIVEGREMVDAARRYDRIVQHGTQWRSEPMWREFAADIRNGKYGTLQTAVIQIVRPRKSIGVTQPVNPPRELDYNLWVGPAPMQPYRTNLVHYQWHWIWDYGNGEMGNLGAHMFEMARWALPDGANPLSVASLGGRFGYEDQGQTPNTQLTTYDYGCANLVCQVRGLDYNNPIRMSIDFHTDQGVVKDGKFFPHGDQTGMVIKNAPGSGLPENYARGHFQNFIDCVRSRKHEDLNSDILDGHRTAILAHLGNISYRLGEETPFNKQAKWLLDSEIARHAFNDLQRHLVDVAGMKLADSTYRLGQTLQFDPVAENFIDSTEGNRLLGRQGRDPFVTVTHS